MSKTMNRIMGVGILCAVVMFAAALTAVIFPGFTQAAYAEDADLAAGDINGALTTQDDEEGAAIENLYVDPSKPIVFQDYYPNGKLERSIAVKNNSGKNITDSFWYVYSIDGDQALEDMVASGDFGEVVSDYYNIAAGKTGNVPFYIPASEWQHGPSSMWPGTDLQPGTYTAMIRIEATNVDGVRCVSNEFPIKVVIGGATNASGQIDASIATLKVGKYTDSVQDPLDLVTAYPGDVLDFGEIQAGSTQTEVRSLPITIMNTSTKTDTFLGSVPAVSVIDADIADDHAGSRETLAFSTYYYYPSNPVPSRVTLQPSTSAGAYTLATMYAVQADATYLPAGTYETELAISVSPQAFTWNGHVVTDGKIRMKVKMKVVGDNPNLPPAPTGLTATAGNGYVTLNWNEEASLDNTGYVIFRKSGNGGFEKVGETDGVHATTYTDTTAVNGTAYTYVVCDQLINAPFSNEATATPSASAGAAKLPAPVLYGCDDNGDGKTGTLRWAMEDSDGNMLTGADEIDHFVIYRDGSPIQTYSQNSYQDANYPVWEAPVSFPTAGQEYTFAVAAVDKNGVVGFLSEGAQFDIDNPQAILTQASLEYGALDGGGKGVRISLYYEGEGGWSTVVVKRNGTVIDSFEYGYGVDRSVQAGKTYTYTFTPYDYNGNQSGPESQSFEITIADGAAVYEPQAYWMANGGVVTAWGWIDNASAEASDKYTLNLCCNGVAIQTKTLSKGKAFWDYDTKAIFEDRPAADGTYEYHLELTNTRTGAITKSPSYTYVKNSRIDNLLTAPNAPTNVAAIAGSDKAKITWQAPTSGSEVDKYVVYYQQTTIYDGEDPSVSSWYEAGTADGDELSLVTNTASNGSYYVDYTYVYKVVAVNAAGKSVDSSISNSINPAEDSYWYTTVPEMPEITGLYFKFFGDDYNGYWTVLEAQWKAAEIQDVDVDRYEYAFKKDGKTWEEIPGSDFGGAFESLYSTGEEESSSVSTSATISAKEPPAGIYTLELTAYNKKGASQKAVRTLVWQPIDMANCEIAAIPAQAETGKQIKPQVTVSYQGAPLTEGVDYTVSYGANKTPGVQAGSVTITGIDQGSASGKTAPRTGAQTVKFNIVSSIENADFSGAASAVYSGLAPVPVVKDGSGHELVAGEDFTYTWLDSSGKLLAAPPIAAGNYRIRYMGTGTAYAGTVEKPFTITRKVLDTAPVCTPEQATFTGSGVSPNVTVGNLVPGADYQVSYRDAFGNTVEGGLVSAGTYMVVVTGIGNYSGEMSTVFTVGPLDVSDATSKSIVLNGANATYNGGARDAAMTVVVNGAQLEQNFDYRLAYKDAQGNAVNGSPVNAGTYTVSAVMCGSYGQGNYTGTLTASGVYTVLPADISQVKVEGISEYGYSYTSRPIIPEFTLTFNEQKVAEDDYSFIYKDASGATVDEPTDLGDYTIVVTGARNFTGTLEIPFSIKTSIDAADIALRQTNFTYDGNAKTPAVSVKMDGIELQQDKDYTLEYKNNVKPGTAQAIIVGMGNYTGMVEKPFTIKKAEWTRLAGANRYSTMKAIVAAGFKSSEYAVVASGDNFPDALAASALAGKLHAPVVLTDPSSLTTEAKAILKSLGVTKVYIIGGTPAVSKKVADSIDAMTGVSVTRIAGDSRQATALAVMKQVGSCDTVIVATGENFPDSLSIAPYSYAKSVPIVLTEKDGTLSADALKQIKASGATQAIIVGSETVVAKSVVTKLKSNGVSSVTRLAGANRYETSQKIADWELKNGMSASVSTAATGENFPDALAGAALTGANEGILVLVKDKTSVGIETLSAQKANITQGYIYGSSTVVSDSLAEYIATQTGMTYK